MFLQKQSLNLHLPVEFSEKHIKSHFKSKYSIVTDITEPENKTDKNQYDGKK